MKQFTTIFLLLLISFTIRANDTESKTDSLDVMEMILEHISDSHEWHIISYTNRHDQEVHISIPLPVILWHEGRPWMFLSDDFSHHEAPLPLGNDYVTLHKDKFYLTDAGGHLNRDEAGLITNARPLDFSITRNVASMFLSVLILLGLFISAGRAYARRGMAAPTGIRAFLEPIILYVRDDIARTQIPGKKADQFVPYLLTLFFFIFINNLLGLIPFFPGSTNVSGNIAFTGTLAVISFLAINVFASADYWKHIFTSPGSPLWVKVFLVPIEFVGIFTKPFALMIRLFANMTAGHIIILCLVALIFVLKSLYIAPVSIILSLVMYLLELLVAVLQAYIFTLLTALFIGMASNSEKH